MIPKKITVLGTEYKVEVKNKEDDKELNEGDLWGYVNYFDKRIVIQETDKIEQKETTFNHELMHTVLYEAGYESYCHDETLINALERLIPKIKHLIL